MHESHARHKTSRKVLKHIDFFFNITINNDGEKSLPENLLQNPMEPFQRKSAKSDATVLA